MFSAIVHGTQIKHLWYEGQLNGSFCDYTVGASDPYISPVRAIHIMQNFIEWLNTKYTTLK